MNHFAFKGGKRYARQLCPPEVKRIRPDGPPEVDPKASPEDQEIQKELLKNYKQHEREKAKWKRMGAYSEEKRDPMVARLCPDDARADDGKVTWERRSMDGVRHETFIMRHEPKSQWVHTDEYLWNISAGTATPRPIPRTNGPWKWLAAVCSTL